jgi:hypothetical protein
MTLNAKTLALGAIAAVAVAAAPAQAAVVTLFQQDFSAGLGADEQLFGNFAVGGGRMGHVNGYYGNNEQSHYDLKLDLTGVTDALIAFDYNTNTEYGWDGWNLLGAIEGQAFNFTSPLIASPNVHNRFVEKLLSPGVTGMAAGRATYDLTPFAGKVVNLRLRFASDHSITRTGTTFDNLVATGTAKTVSAAPEPSTWAIMITGFMSAGMMLRRRRAVAI